MRSHPLWRAAVIAAALLTPVAVSSQTLTLGAAPKQIYCSGEQFQISYTADGSFSSKNSFVVQLSEPNGSFTTFQNIGSIRTTESGMVGVTIPSTITNGTAYRIRLMSTDPYALSGDNGSDLSMGPPSDPSYEYERVFAKVGDEIQLKHRSANAVSVRWDFGPDAEPQFSSEHAPRVRFNTSGFKSFSLTTISAGGCEVTRKFEVNSPDHRSDAFLYIASCTPQIPADVRIDSFESVWGHNEVEDGPFWIVPGGVYDNYGPHSAEFFVEAGGTLKSIIYYNVVYLKAGASLHEPLRGSLVIREAGSSVVDTYDRNDYIECDDLEFDYSVAPPYKIEQAAVSDDQAVIASIYPNPASTSIYRNDIGERLIGARLYSITGALVMTSLEPSGREIMSVRDIAPGLYNLELHFADAIRFQKILIQR